MSPAQWRAVKTVFEAALDADAETRDAVLQAATPEIRDEVRRLLANHAESGELFLDRPLLDPSQLIQITDEESAVFSVGERLLDRFEIRRFVGRGGMGEVYEAFDAELRETVAIKTIRVHLTNDPQFGQRFRQEVQRSRKIAHPNVCRVYDLFTAGTRLDPNALFLTMEFLEGSTLQAEIREHGRLNMERAISIGEQLCDGLCAAHDCHIIHRDLKPANVMLVGEDAAGTRAVITDFGLAQPLEPRWGDSPITTEGKVAGTLAYLAPELLEGQPPSYLSDIYALGVVLYEMFSGHHPFEAPDELVSAALRLRNRPKPLRDHAPEVPIALERVILSCLATFPGQRPQSVSQVRGWLRGGGLSGWAAAFSTMRSARIARRSWILGGISIIAGGAAVRFLMRRSAADFSPLQLGIETDAAGTPAGRTINNLLRVALMQSPYLKVLAAVNPGQGGAPDYLKHANAVLRSKVAFRDGGYGIELSLVDLGTQRVFYSGGEWSSFKDLSETIDRLSVTLRHTLGEDLESIRNHSRPLEYPDTLSPEALELFTKGLACYYEGEIENALGLFENATRLDPEFAMAYVYQAVVNSALRREEAAFGPAQRAFVLRDHLNIRGRNQAEWIYYSISGDFERSLDKKRVLAAMYPAEAQLQRSVAHAFSFVQRFDEALRHARAAVRLDPGNASNRVILAGILAQANRPDEALAEMREARRQMPDKPILFDGEGFAYLIKGDLDAASRAFDQLARVRDLEPIAAQYRITVMLLQGKLSEAREQLAARLEIAVSRGQHSEEDLHRYWLGQLCVVEGDIQGAKLHASALAGRSALPPCMFSLRAAAEIAAEAGATATLRTAALKLEAIKNTYPSTRSEAIFSQANGLLAQTAGKTQSAKGYFAHAYTLWPDLSNAWTRAGCLRNLGEHSEALNLYESVIAAKGTALRFESVNLWIRSFAAAASCFYVLGDCKNALNRSKVFVSMWGDTRVNPVNQSGRDASNCAAK